MSDNLQEDLVNGKDRQGSYDISLRRHQFIEYLDKEIDNLRNEIQRPGWTSYAILGGIAALVWTLIYCFDAGGYSLRNVAFLILGFSLLRDLLIMLFPSAKPPRLDLKLKRRFINRNFLSSNRGALFLIGGQYGFFLFVSLKLSQDLGTFTTIFTSAFLSLLLLAILSGALLFFLKFPIPMSPPRKRLNIAINTIIILSFLVIISRYLGFFLVSPSITLIADIRVALLIVAIFYLLLIKIRVPKGNLILDSLVMTRRELALDEIDLDTARIHTDIALTGLRTSDVLEEYLTTLLSLYREAATDLKEASRYLKDVEILDSEKQDDQAKQATFAHPLLETVDKLITKARDIINTRIPKASNRLLMRVFWISTQVEISDTIDELGRKLGDARKDLEEQTNSVRERLKTLMDVAHSD